MVARLEPSYVCSHLISPAFVCMRKFKFGDYRLMTNKKHESSAPHCGLPSLKYQGVRIHKAECEIKNTAGTIETLHISLSESKGVS